MAKRKYTKKNLEYWSSLEKSKGALESKKVIEDLSKDPFKKEDQNESFEPLAVYGDDFETAKASRTTHSSRDNGILRRGSDCDIQGKLQTLATAGEPFVLEGQDSYSVRDAVKMCQKAYYAVASFANSIDIMSEFSNTDHYLEGSTATARNFFDKWLKKINIENLKQQYFREYFRGGNIFLYRIDGDLDTDGIKRLSTIGEETLKTTKVPLKYTMLNPSNIVAQQVLSFNSNSYSQVLTKTELDRLATSTREMDKAIFQSLTKEQRETVAAKKTFARDQGLLIDINPSKVLMSFYKKQDYEPFAVPFGFRVLDDIDKKMKLKNIDAAVARSVENVVLLITMGESPKQGGLGVNQKNIEAIQTIFETHSTGSRVLVSDYTTKAAFVIPDLEKAMGKEKYEILNQDIKEGLQNIIVGKENYSSTQMKAEMFLERLKEARHCFINDVIQPEIKRLASLLGFKKYPIFKFKELDLKDQDTLMRVVTRMTELAILTPEQGMEVINTGEFPDSESLEKGHKGYLEKRKEGFYNPLVGGVPMYENPTLANSADKNIENQINKTPSQSGRPDKAIASKTATVDDFKSTLGQIYALEGFVEVTAKEKYGVNDLNDQQKKLCQNLCLSIVESHDQKKWESVATECINDISKQNSLTIKSEIEKLMEDNSIESYPAAILFHSIQQKNV